MTAGAVVPGLIPAGRWRLPSVASGLYAFVALLLVHLRPRTSRLGTIGASGQPKLVDVRSGRAIVGGDAALGCAVNARDSGLLSGGASCIDPGGKPFTKTMTTGVLDFMTMRFGEDMVTPLSVPLGGPFQDSKGSPEPYVMKQGPGAVFMYSEFAPVDGVKHRLVGLN